MDAQKIIFWAVFTIVLGGAYFLGRSSANQDALLAKYKAEAKFHEMKAKAWEDSAARKDKFIADLTKDISKLAHQSDSLSKIEHVVVNHITFMPTIKYKASQLDSLWQKRYSH